MREPAVVGNWQIRVLGIIHDATAEVLDENMFNAPPSQHDQYALITVEATYQGDDADSLLGSLGFSAVGASAVELPTCFGVVPDELDTFVDVYPGGTISGKLCFEMPASDEGTLLVAVEEYLAFSDSKVFLATTRDQ